MATNVFLANLGTVRRRLAGGLLVTGLVGEIGAVPMSHPNDVKVALPGRISACSPTHTVEATLIGAGHIAGPEIQVDGAWDTSEAAEYGSRVEINGYSVTVIAGPKLKRGSFTLYYRGSWSGCSTCGSGDFEDSVVIDVETDEDEECGDCERQEFGSATVGYEEVKFRLHLGRAAVDRHGRGQSAGYLELQAAVPSTNFISPAALRLPYLRPGVERVPTNVPAALEAVRVPQGLVVVNGVTNGYALHCYDRTQVDANWQLLSNALPFVTWTLVTPEGNLSLLQVTENRGGLERVHLYSHTAGGNTNTWRLDRPDGSYSRSETVTNGQDYTRSHELRNADDSLARRVWSVWQYRTNLGAALVVQRVAGDGAVTETNLYSYYPDDLSVTANLLERVVCPNGRWIFHTYDALGRPDRIYST